VIPPDGTIPLYSDCPQNVPGYFALVAQKGWGQFLTWFGARWPIIRPGRIAESIVRMEVQKYITTSPFRVLPFASPLELCHALV
jgi:hypothetical protein